MQKLEVFGANKLRGQIKISGSKNASLPILAATLLSNKITHLKNLPKVMDIQTMLLLLESLGSKIKVKKHKTIIDNMADIHSILILLRFNIFSPSFLNGFSTNLYVKNPKKIDKAIKDVFIIKLFSPIPIILAKEKIG